MESDHQDSKPNDRHGRRPQKQENKQGSPAQTGKLQDPAEDQTSDAQLNQGQGNQRRQDSQIELSQQHEQSHEDIFSDEASNDPQLRTDEVDSGQSGQKI
jgi:hypothetical protein